MASVDGHQFFRCNNEYLISAFSNYVHVLTKNTSIRKTEFHKAPRMIGDCHISLTQHFCRGLRHDSLHGTIEELFAQPGIFFQLDCEAGWKILVSNEIKSAGLQRKLTTHSLARRIVSLNGHARKYDDKHPSLVRELLPRV